MTYRNNGTWSKPLEKCIKICPRNKAPAIGNENLNNVSLNEGKVSSTGTFSRDMSFIIFRQALHDHPNRIVDFDHFKFSFVQLGTR